MYVYFQVTSTGKLVRRSVFVGAKAEVRYIFIYFDMFCLFISALSLVRIICEFVTFTDFIVHNILKPYSTLMPKIHLYHFIYC